VACKQANRKPTEYDAAGIWDAPKDLSAKTLTLVKLYKDGRAATFAKTQCMHCVDPACVSACLVNALDKLPEGPVVYRADRCIGCRYCMAACPFEIPKFEYDRPLPLIRKCTFCTHRLREGKLPACAEVCPSGALQFGKRRELLEVAKTRIYQNPNRYVHHVYGEHEVGGTSWLYLTDVPFEQLGFRMDLGTTAYPELTWTFLSAVPFVLTLWPPFLMGLYAFTRSRERAAGEPEQETRHE
ncbi:MAG TPA: 4Fe-4S ferredoxin, partial [Candidatus Rokubacteria bacterium]|nr:4Fe-4S ferredoxin [Candidatus Rokubacteria bacterium]